jgi:hypothetical protein
VQAAVVGRGAGSTDRIISFAPVVADHDVNVIR